VALAALVTGVNFKTNKNGEPWAILTLEDLTDKAEVLLMASSFDPHSRQKTRPFDNNRDLALTDRLLMVTGELRAEISDSAAEEEDDLGDRSQLKAEQVQIKIYAKKLEPLQYYQGRGFIGALVQLPEGRYPERLLPILKQNVGLLPLTLEYIATSGEIVKIKAAPKYSINFSPGLAEQLLVETGCLLRWIH
jgi:DNA polymerase-3 subunit alpha